MKDEIPDYMDSSPPPPNLIDSSDVESNAGSIDSIAGQGRFYFSTIMVVVNIFDNYYNST